MRRTLLPMLLTVAAIPTAAAAATWPSYEVTNVIAGPAGGGWDYAHVDASGTRLFVAHGDAVSEVNLAKGDAVRSIGHIEHGHAVVPIPGTTTLLVTSGQDSTVRLIDTSAGRELGTCG